MVHNPIRNSEEDLKENILYYYVSVSHFYCGNNTQGASSLVQCFRH